MKINVHFKYYDADLWLRNSDGIDSLDNIVLRHRSFCLITFRMCFVLFDLRRLRSFILDTTRNDLSSCRM